MKNISKVLIQNIGIIIDFYQCMIHLGPVKGFYYWRLQCAARRDPSICKRIIKNISKEIKYCDEKSRPAWRKIKQDFQQAYDNYRKK